MYDEIVSKDFFMLKYCLDRYKTQKMFNKVTEAFFTNIKICSSLIRYKKQLKSLMMLYSLMIIYSFLMKILVMSQFLVMKWIF